MKVGTRPDDKLISKFKIIHEDCPIRVIDKIHVNGLELTANQGKYQIKK